MCLLNIHITFVHYNISYFRAKFLLFLSKFSIFPPLQISSYISQSTQLLLLHMFPLGVEGNSSFHCCSFHRSRFDPCFVVSGFLVAFTLLRFRLYLFQRSQDSFPLLASCSSIAFIQYSPVQHLYPVFSLHSPHHQLAPSLYKRGKTQKHLPSNQ